jgi:MraZ protein
MLNTGWGPLKLDQRSRLGLPPRAREGFETVGDQAELYLGVLPGAAHPSIWVMSKDQLLAFRKRLGALGDTEAGRLVKTATIGSFTTAMMDPQGRVTIPDELLEQAGIKDHVMLVGLEDRLEVWSKDALDGLLKSRKEQIRQGLETLFDLEAAVIKSNALGLVLSKPGEGSRPPTSPVG